MRWFLGDTRMSSLARDNAISVSTAYDYRDEGIAVLAVRRPSLHAALLAAKIAGHSHVIVDGTLIHTDRIATRPHRGVDLWWSGKHKHHGGNVQVVSAPDGWPLWTSQVRPGREHDMTAARTDPDLVAMITAWITDGRPGLAFADAAGLICWTLSVDSTINRAHQHAAGARRSPDTQVEPPGPEPADHALGRSRGGWTTKVHLACEQGRKPLSLVLTAGQRGHSPQFAPVLERIRVSRCGPGRPRTRPDRV